ncbi:MAG: hypothetical protein AB7S78_01195 [Candidatus Omnitrophota bacterium]
MPQNKFVKNILEVMSVSGLVIVLCSGCSPEKIEVYKVVKIDPEEKMAVLQPESASKKETDSFCPKPMGWKPDDPGPMQRARFTRLTEDGRSAEISIVVLPGEAGGDLPNINRWRRQIGLDPVDNAALGDIIRSWTIGERTLKQVHLENGDQSIDMVYLLDQGQSYFYKMQGDKKLAGDQLKVFLAFVHTIWSQP